MQYAGLTLSYWNMVLEDLLGPEFGDADLDGCAELFAKALEMAEKHLAREADDPDTAQVTVRVDLWDEASEGLEGIASPLATPLERVQALRAALADRRQMAAMLYCLRGTGAMLEAHRLQGDEHAAERRAIQEGRALPAFREALRWKPGYARAQEYAQHLEQAAVTNQAISHYNQGLDYFQQQRWDEAIREWEAALRLKPDYGNARDNLAVAHANRAKVLEADGQLELALQEARLAVEMGFEGARSDVERIGFEGRFASALVGSQPSQTHALLARFRHVPLAMILIGGGAALLLGLLSLPRRGMPAMGSLPQLIGGALLVVGFLTIAGIWPGPRLRELPANLPPQQRREVERLHRPARAWMVGYALLGVVLGALLVAQGESLVLTLKGVPAAAGLMCVAVGVLPMLLGLRARGWVSIAVGGATILLAVVVPMSRPGAVFLVRAACLCLCGVVSVVDTFRYRSAAAGNAAS